MHIALVSRYLRAARGGHERYLKRLIKALTGRGWRVSAFSGEFDPDLKDAGGLECIEVSCLKFPQSLRYISFNRNALRMLRAHGGAFDLVFTTEYVTFGDVYRAGAGIARAELEMCGGAADRLLPKNRVKMLLQKKLMSGDLRRVIVNSESMRRQVLEYFNFDQERISLVYNGIDTSVFRPSHPGGVRMDMRGRLGLSGDEFVCLAVGSNWWRKGLDRAIKMLGLVDERRLKLLVVGCKRRELERFTTPGDERIVFQERVSDMRPYYDAADLCVIASRYDPAPNVMLEALACALPVAVSSECGLTELLEDGAAGAVFETVDGLARIALDYMEMADGGGYGRMRRRAAEIGRRFSMERHVEEIMALLESLQNA